METGILPCRFWEGEYASGTLSGDDFDWFFDFDHINEARWTHLIRGHLSIGQILVIGCGTSSLSSRLAMWLPEARVISIDSSHTCIERMRASCGELEWFECDATRLSTLPQHLGDDDTYDVVVDKGCLDALLSYADNNTAAKAAVREAHRVLRPRGRFVVISCTRSPSDGDDRDGFGGGSPDCQPILYDVFWRVESEEVTAPLNRGLAPCFDEVRPQSYAALVAIKLEEHLADYYEFYAARPEPNEAFASWAVVGSMVQPYLSMEHSLLDVGCGNSDVGAKLATLVKEYVGLDAVPAVIQRQRRAYPALDWRIADARELDHGLLPDSFGTNRVAFDKGTADALFMYGLGDQPVLDYLAALARIDISRFIVVACARTDGILEGEGAPRLVSLLASRPFLSLQWTLVTHQLLHSDVGAGPRTFDFLVFDRGS